MESSTFLQSLHQSLGSASQCMLEKHAKVQLHGGSWATFNNSCVRGLKVGRSRNLTLVSCAKASETSPGAKIDDSSDSSIQATKEKKTLRRLTFPNELEALVHEVCDGTEVAELKLKVGDFEMHLKRKIGAPRVADPLSNISPTVPPPIPTKPMNETAPIAKSPPQTKPSAEKSSPFINHSFGKSSKLAALEASGSSNYVLVSSPTVGTFQRNKTAKGKKLPPCCKEGDVIKEGQVVGYLNQFGTELPVKSDVAGEVLKLLYDDGDAVGYGDPLTAILPCFHDINLK